MKLKTLKERHIKQALKLYSNILLYNRLKTIGFNVNMPVIQDINKPLDTYLIELMGNLLPPPLIESGVLPKNLKECISYVRFPNRWNIK